MYEDRTELINPAQHVGHEEPAPPPPSRRRFMKWLTHGMGAMFAVVLGAPMIAYLIDPRNKKAGTGDFRTVARFDELPLDQPRQGTISDVRTDAWTLHPNDVIGRVWLIRKSEEPLVTSSEDKKAKATLLVFSTICPHLGCSINFEKKDDLFRCPCHNGTFSPDGEKKDTGKMNPAPRHMDDIAYRIEDDPENPGKKLVKVKYESFLQGEEEKIART